MHHEIKFSAIDADLAAIKWRLDSQGYALNKKHQKAHHVVVERMFGQRPKAGSGLVCDHINRVRLDNRRENLRVVDIIESSKNRNWPKRENYGVYKVKGGKFRVMFWRGKKLLSFGYYQTESEALAVRAKVEPTLPPLYP